MGVIFIVNVKINYLVRVFNKILFNSIKISSIPKFQLQNQHLPENGHT